MESSIDLIATILPNIENVTVVNVDGELYLVDTSNLPTESDLVLTEGNKLKRYNPATMTDDEAGDNDWPEVIGEELNHDSE